MVFFGSMYTPQAFVLGTCNLGRFDDWSMCRVLQRAVTAVAAGDVTGWCVVCYSTCVVCYSVLLLVLTSPVGLSCVTACCCWW